MIWCGFHLSAASPKVASSMWRCMPIHFLSHFICFHAVTTRSSPIPLCFCMKFPRFSARAIEFPRSCTPFAPSLCSIVPCFQQMCASCARVCLIGVPCCEGLGVKVGAMECAFTCSGVSGISCGVPVWTARSHYQFSMRPCIFLVSSFTFHPSPHQNSTRRTKFSLFYTDFPHLRCVSHRAPRDAPSLVLARTSDLF